MTQVYIGTSGFSYRHWEDKVFYPSDLARTKQLEFYSQHFKTVEINSSFYHLPTAQAFQGWYQRTPRDFIFAVKVSRFITHIKKLKVCREPWQRFINNAKELREKLGPILFQLPPGWQFDVRRLERFVKILPKKYRYVFEFRHPSWFCSEIFKILKKYNISLCLADSPRWPYQEEITADFVYLRMHGGKILYGSNYSDKELKEWAKKIKKFLEADLDVYVYFNNDAYGYAVKNAQRLIELVR
jgi:uncharacterized protein YecE (DUF72 family)